MPSYRRRLLWINLLGGAAVIGSYIVCLSGRPDAADALWGGVPESIRPFYTAGMLLAAAGYFAFSYFLLFRLEFNRAKVFGRFDARAFHWLYAGILVFSALWMPATIWAIDGRSVPMVWAVRIILVWVALFSLGLLAALSGVEPREPAWAHTLAVAGAVLFCVQTVVLDAVVWNAAFRI